MRIPLFALYLLLTGISSAHSEVQEFEQKAADISYIHWFNQDQTAAVAYGRFPQFVALRDFVVKTMETKPTSVLSIANDAEKLILMLDEKRQFIEVYLTDNSIVVGNMSYVADNAVLKKFKKANLIRQQKAQPVSAYLISLVNDNYTQISSL